MYNQHYDGIIRYGATSSMNAVLFAMSIVVGYFLGSIPTGYLVAKANGVDIQKVGSGNIGATNVLRAVGLIPAIIVILADPLKAMLAVFLSIAFGVSEWGVALTALATVLGNNFNIFLRLRGGKGIATSLGAFMLISPAVTLAAALIGIFTIAVGRFVSLGALVALFSAPLLVALSSFTFPSFTLAILLCLLAMFRHRQNLVRLSTGSERRLGEKAKPS